MLAHSPPHLADSLTQCTSVKLPEAHGQQCVGAMSTRHYYPSDGGTPLRYSAFRTCTSLTAQVPAPGVGYSRRTQSSKRTIHLGGFDRAALSQCPWAEF